jgi:hypothetical protein
MADLPLLISSIQANIGRRARMKLIGWGLVALLVPSVAWAQGATTHDRAEHSTMHAGMHAAASLPSEAGQGAFAAIAEIVLLLQADPETDWSKVDIGALREHLVDMNELTLNAVAREEPIPGGLQIEITGEGRTLRAIRNMVPAHAAELAKVEGWQVDAAARDGGARLTVTSADPRQEAQIRGLGFFGLMATGGHHQMHHWAMATGRPMHGD